jgi:hypothetical protein
MERAVSNQQSRSWALRDVIRADGIRKAHEQGQHDRRVDARCPLCWHDAGEASPGDRDR